VGELVRFGVAFDFDGAYKGLREVKRSRMKANILNLFLGLTCTGLLAMGASAQTFINLHSFTALDSKSSTNTDGAVPYAGLVLSGNRLYGTVNEGGDFDNGAIFAVNTDGTGYTNLYGFTGGNDGGGPYDELFLSGNTLYGTADYGGTNGWGAIFTINTDGSAFKDIYSFPANNYSDAGLIMQGNLLYGITEQGGTAGKGTVFAVNPDGTGFTNLYNFAGADGATPNGPLMLSGNALYGTTYRGGSFGWGTVFAVNTDGTGFTNLYNFTGGTDGASPQYGLVLSGNVLYGTASSGGLGNGLTGVIFAIHTDGTGFTNIYSFSPGGVSGDGDNPYAGLTLSGNTLYGAAVDGGSGNSGTIFSVNTDGTGFTTLYSFTPTGFDPDNFSSTNSDGAGPYGTLLLSGNTLYGTANYGGNGGNGTVFKVVLPTPPWLSIAPAGGSLIVSWPSSTDANFVLQQNLDLSTVNWSTNGLTISDDGTNKSAIIIPTAGSDFFRLANTNGP
jgi:uncharacterized repeat protein (TIGR03803 family)